MNNPDLDVNELVQLMKKLKPGFLPFEVFIQIARLVVLPIIEFVPLRVNKDEEIEILLLERPKDDRFWPGEVHVPGTVVRATDDEGKTYLAFDRIINEELNNIEISDPQYIGSIFHASKRGKEQAQVYWVEVLGDATVGKFHSVNNLPSNLINSQREFIDLAINDFKNVKKIS